MNFLAKILLVIFIFAQSAPSLISIIDEDSSIDFVEDDQKAKEEKYKAEFIYTEVKTPHVFALKKSKEINTNYLIKEYCFFSSINILPPEQV
jgi:thioredoxin-related protein